jgi:hypothetical protein
MFDDADARLGAQASRASCWSRAESARRSKRTARRRDDLDRVLIDDPIGACCVDVHEALIDSDADRSPSPRSTPSTRKGSPIRSRPGNRDTECQRAARRKLPPSPLAALAATPDRFAHAAGMLASFAPSAIPPSSAISRL